MIDLVCILKRFSEEGEVGGGRLKNRVVLSGRRVGLDIVIFQ